MRLVCKRLLVPHHFTLPYSRWINGTVKHLSKKPLRMLRAIFPELQMNQNKWPDKILIVQNHGLRSATTAG